MIVTFPALERTLGPWPIASPQYASIETVCISERKRTKKAGNCGYYCRVGELIGQSLYISMVPCMSRLVSTVDPSLAGGS